MSKNIDINRIRVWLNSISRPHWDTYPEYADLIAILEDYATIQPLVDMADDLIERNTKLEAELDAARPLLEAAKGADVTALRIGMTDIDDKFSDEPWMVMFMPIFRAALKLREEK